jgi:hypothetical protein
VLVSLLRGVPTVLPCQNKKESSSERAMILSYRDSSRRLMLVAVELSCSRLSFDSLRQDPFRGEELHEPDHMH